jgi:5-methylthioadenosine/S-adenosylhomocysteine deaminase
MKQVHHSRFVLPISSDPIEDGAVVVENGLIVDVDSMDVIRDGHADAEIVDHGNSAILPGL